MGVKTPCVDLERGEMSISEVVLHLGAHRTGTTSLQSYLRANRELLRGRGVACYTPRELRRGTDIEFDGVACCIVSEENLIGSMRNNMARCTLYSDVGGRLRRHAQLLAQTSTVVLSIRDLADWWRSAILFTLYSARQPITVPSPADMARIAARSRGWMQVVEDIHAAVPHARLVVRDFDWRTRDPEKFLTRATGWHLFAGTETKLDKGNVSPSVQALGDAFTARQDFNSRDRLDKLDADLLFCAEAVTQLRAKYSEDLARLKACDFVTFLGQHCTVASA